MACESPWAGRRLHFVGIGGAGMSGLAVVARALGAQVSGSDRAAGSPYTATLARAGIEPAIGHSAAHVPEGAELVVSSAIPTDNPERAAARERGLSELHRADLLGELTRLKPTIAVTGTHGKTTTTSMVVHALRACGMDPSYLVGGDVRSTGTNAHWGKGEWLVVEADESDRSLLKLAPTIAVLTNAELDHHTTYASKRDVEQTFRAFLALARTAVVWERPQLRALASGPHVEGFDARDVMLNAGGSTFTLDGVSMTLGLPGIHNALNAAAALTACRLAGADPAAAAAALASFTGAGRRFERLGHTAAGALVVDDYAHHPTEVRATIEAARTLGPARVVAVFQPHLFSRTERQAREFGAALALADRVVVCEIYPARERAADFPGVTGLRVAEAAADAATGRSVAWLPDFDTAEAFLRSELRDGDLCLTLGAGDVDALGRRLVQSVIDGPRRAGVLARGSKEARMSGAGSISWRVPRVLSARSVSPRLLVALVLVLAGTVAGWLWLRDSPLTQVRDVSVVGLTSSDSGRIRAALEDAATDMSTLHVRDDALRAAVAQFPSVASLRTDADFPHALTIEVVERRPVAVLGSSGAGVPVTGAGRLLRGLRAAGLPRIALPAAPGGARVSDARTLAALAIAATAPGALHARAEQIAFGVHGLEVALRDGPRLIFGAADDVRAKWAAAARVLAEPSAQGATYLDLRVRGRVAAGGVGPVDPAEEAAEDGSASTIPNAQP